MRIQHLELVGFKSFADKTRLTFDDGITVIVGPNGCGKSNVVDAIRWVMGELSAKSLRGNEMMDVIFAGSTGRKPISMAQVSMVFSCDDGLYPQGYENVAEIEITRRLFRSGESQYLINRMPCRLKDIQEMLMDTGIGARTYAVIEQGQIAKLLSMKPTERRFLIEEAAGTTKYRVRREETQRKIDQTRSNLDRVEDVVSEVRRQVNSLARQAGKARRYKEYADSLKAIEFELAARESRVLSEEDAAVSARLAELKRNIEQATASIETEEQNLEARRLDHLKASREAEQRQEQLSGLSDEIRVAESELASLRQQIAEHQAKVAHLELECRKAEDAIPGHAADAETAGAEARECDGRIESLQGHLTEMQQRLAIFRETRQDNMTNAERLRREIAEATHRVASLAGQVEASEAGRTRDEESVAALQIKHAELAELIANLEGESAAQQDDVDTLRARRAELEESLTQARAAANESQSRLDAAKHELDRARSEHESVKARHESLLAVKRSLEGYSEGVKRLLSTDEGAERAAGALDVLGHLIEVEPRFEPALEAALGNRVQGVVFEQAEQCLAAAQQLSTGEPARYTFVPVGLRPAKADYPETTRSQTLGPLSEFVRADERFRGTVASLLDNVLVVESLDEALRLHKANGYAGAFVTLSGEYIDPYGVITGGAKEAAEAGLLARNRRIKELSAESDVLAEKVAEAHRAVEAATAARLAAREHRDGVSASLDQIKDRLAEAEGALKKSKSEGEGLTSQQARLTTQIDQTRTHIAQRAEAAEKALGEMNRLEEHIRQLRGELENREDRLFANSREVDELQHEVTEQSSLLAGLKERRKAAHDRETAATWAKKRMEEDLAARRSQIRQTSELVSELTAKVQAAEGELAGKSDMAGNSREEIAAVRRSLDETEQELTEAETALRAKRHELTAWREENSKAEVRHVELGMKREHIVQRLMDNYGVALDELPEPDELPEDEEATSLDDLKAQRRDLQEMLGKIGEVNVAAVEEHQEASERLDFYLSQKADLDEAIADLEKAIAKINRESKQRFLDAFNAVSERFAVVLPKLFGGGSAQLTLTDPDDPLESGLEISVKPPGKKLTNINLLSGGEKAMSSIGLIFSIFLIKPSPFCLLDEVDAPLDDANIDRFNHLIEMIREHSQVIVITHNKRTMKTAETLYGVSMQEPGVSKLVSVRFDEDEDLDHAPELDSHGSGAEAVL
ncbi:MAG: chromosome segregation protein SMC [Deltaproteobacteria bacterium]|nr:chromosome segregation protein SMC [Deltaproteobacteria bacterium]